LVEGIGVAADPARGAALVAQAAEEGDENAEFAYGDYLERGVGVAQDVRAAAAYYKRAMDHGHPDARAAHRRCARRRTT
jgi:TPR repeat protein